MKESEVEQGFEWHLEEELWPAKPPAAAKRPTGRLSRRWPVSGLVAFCLVVLVGLLGYRQWQHRLAAVADSATVDLLVVHGLMQQAAARGDGELLSTLLRGTPDRWQSLQNDLIRAELYLDRPALGLWVHWDALPAAAGDAVPEVHLSPALDRAEVVALLPYLIETIEGATTTVQLQQTLFYERSGTGDHWFLAPPADTDFRQGWVTDRQEHLTLIYPGRDEAVGRRLALDLNRLLGRLCHEAAVICLPGTRFEIRLEREPQSLMLLAENYRRVDLGSNPRRPSLRLPAPGLVGSPVDEPGYDALYRGYAAWVAAVLVHGAGRQAAPAGEVAPLLATFGLRPPPLAGYHPLYGQRPPPVPFPEQELQLLCTWFDGASIWRYRPPDDSWRSEWAEASDHGLNFMRDEASLAALPYGQGVLLHGLAVDGVPRWRAYLWRDGEAQLLLDEEEPYGYYPFFWLGAATSYDDRFVIFLAPDTAEYMPFGPVRTVDLAQCSGAGCVVQDFDGMPTWSPDGRLVAVNSAVDSWAELHLVAPESSPARAPLALGVGFSPFWWDDEQLGFIRPRFTSGQPVPETTELVVVRLAAATSNGWREEVWLNAAELRAALPAGQAAPEHSLFINGAAKYPGRPDWLFITAVAVGAGGAAHGSFLYAFHPASGDIRYLMSDGHTNLVRFSPSGRYLAALPVGADLETIAIYEFDTEKMKSVYRYGATDFGWSADEQWLALAEEGQVRLLAIEHEYQRLVPHAYRGCFSLAWVEE